MGSYTFYKTKHMRERHSWSFRYERPELTIVPKNWEDSDVWVLVKRTSDLPEHEIRVTYYSTPHIYVEEWYDFTHWLRLPEVTAERDELIVSYPVTRARVELSKFRLDSHMQQFVKDDSDQDSRKTIWSGHELLYLEVPEQLVIHAKGKINLKFTAS